MDWQKSFIAAFDRRRSLFAGPDTDCFRLFNSTADGLDGISVDRYGSWLLVLMEKPGLLQQAEPLFAAIRKAAATLPLTPRGIVCKDITRPDTGCIDELYASTVIDGRAPPAELIVRQNSIRVSIDLMAGRHTGLFLDMRAIRPRLAPYYGAAETMLNLFCYSGVFSAHGLKNGLARALNLDLAKTALTRAQRNYALNSLACEDRDFMYGDAITWMKAFVRQGRRFDFVILDPPTFARSRKGQFSVKKDFPRCLALAQKLAPGGHALTVINSPAVAQDQYLSWHPPAWHLAWLEHESDDFPWEGNPYLKAGLWKIP